MKSDRPNRNLVDVPPTYPCDGITNFTRFLSIRYRSLTFTSPLTSEQLKYMNKWAITLYWTESTVKWGKRLFCMGNIKIRQWLIAITLDKSVHASGRHNFHSIFLFIWLRLFPFLHLFITIAVPLFFASNFQSKYPACKFHVWNIFSEYYLPHEKWTNASKLVVALLAVIIQLKLMCKLPRMCTVPGPGRRLDETDIERWYAHFRMERLRYQSTTVELSYKHGRTFVALTSRVGCANEK